MPARTPGHGPWARGIRQRTGRPAEVSVFAFRAAVPTRSCACNYTPQAGHHGRHESSMSSFGLLCRFAQPGCQRPRCGPVPLAAPGHRPSSLGIGAARECPPTAAAATTTSYVHTSHSGLVVPPQRHRPLYDTRSRGAPSAPCCTAAPVPAPPVRDQADGEGSQRVLPRQTQQRHGGDAGHAVVLLRLKLRAMWGDHSITVWIRIGYTGL